MKQTRKLLTLLLSLALALSLLPAAALAAEADTITRKDFVMKVYEHPAFGLSGRTSSGAVAFSDLDGCTDAEKNAFGVLRDARIFTGGADGKARPSEPMLRYEAAMFIWRAAGSVISGEPGALPYADVPEDTPYYDAVNSLYADGILTDADMDEDGNFHLLDNVTAADTEMWLESFIETGPGNIGSEIDEIDPEALAAELKSLGLFLGSNGNFELDRAPTRAEAVTMLVRLLGQEQTAQSGSWNYSFLDVSAWASGYIGYAYQMGITDGRSSTSFDSNSEASAAMYLTYVLRALGYSLGEDGDFVWSEPYALATQTGILPVTVDLVDFQRGDLVVVSATALGAKLKTSEQTLAEKLIAEGVFTEEQYKATSLSGLMGGTGANSSTVTVTGESMGTNTGTPTGKIIKNTVKVGDIPLYEVFLDDGKAKPVVVVLHGGGGNKEQTLPDAQAYAEQGFFALAVDDAAHGDNTSGPLDAVKCWATTVTQTDAVLDYYATIPQADTERFGLTGGSMGGTICFAYVAHGKHTPVIIAPSAGSPDHTQMSDGSLYDRFGGGREQDYMTREEVQAFAAEYSPVQYPEKFLDVYIYSGIGTKDDTVSLDGVRKLENALRELGGTKFVFEYYEGLGHEGLPAFDPHRALGQILLGDTSNPILNEV